MPEVLLKFSLPDGKTRQCYSPSTIICTYFKKDEMMALTEFLARSRLALNAAAERVRVRHGFTCTAAQAELATLEQLSDRYPGDGLIRILDF